MKNEIRVTYPRSKYLILNREIKEYIDSILHQFLEYGEVTVQPDFPYTLDTYYEKYENQNYLSYAFFTSMYTGGAILITQSIQLRIINKIIKLLLSMI